MNSGSIFDADKLRPQLAEIEKQSAEPNLWSNPQRSQQVMREKKRLEHLLATDADLARRSDDIAAYFELAKEGEKVDGDLRRDIDSLRELVDKLETETLLSGPNDALNAIVTIHPGAGGTESQDWADMLLRMYLRWAERQGFETVLYDYQPGRRSRSEVGDICGERRVCFWAAEQRNWSAPAGADFSFRSGQAAPYFVCQRFCVSGNRRQH